MREEPAVAARLHPPPTPAGNEKSKPRKGHTRHTACTADATPALSRESNARKRRASKAMA